MIIAQTNSTTSGINALLSQTNSTGIAAVILAILGIAAGVTEYFRRSRQSDDRSDSFNTLAGKAKDSIEQTDLAVSEPADMFKQLTQILLIDDKLRVIFQKHGIDFLDKVNKDAIKWKNDIEAYYNKEATGVAQKNSPDRRIKDMAPVIDKCTYSYAAPPQKEGTTEINKVTTSMLDEADKQAKQ